MKPQKLDPDEIRRRVRVGLDRARVRGVRLGRPRVLLDMGRALVMRSEGKSIRATAQALGASTMVVSRALAQYQ
jgi:DNA invertase Pin-like site-specific DNA recombinase